MQYAPVLQDRYTSAKLKLLHLYCHYCFFICYHRATAMTGARFAELITINYLPLRWQSVLLTKNYVHQKTLFVSCPFIYPLTSPHQKVPLITIKSFCFFKRRFLIMKALDFCHSLLPLVLDRNVGREPTYTWGGRKQQNMSHAIGVRCHRTIVT